MNCCPPEVGMKYVIKWDKKAKRYRCRVCGKFVARPYRIEYNEEYMERELESLELFIKEKECESNGA